MRRLVTAVAMLFTGACATAPPAEPRLPFSPPEAWHAAGPETPLRATGASWWHRFGDEQLNSLVDEALLRSPTLGAAGARLEAALAEARIAGAGRRPQVDGGLDASRRRQNFIGLPIPGASGDVLSNTSTGLGVSVGAQWEADLWGRLSAGRGAALARAGATEADVAAIHLSLIGQVAKAWYGWLEAKQQEALAEETLDNRRLTRQQIEARYVRGLRPALELRLALSAEASARAQSVERRWAADRAARRLEVLLARYPGGDSLPGGAPLPASLTPVATGQPAELVTRRPDLIAAELRLTATGLDVRAARAALYPRLRLTASVGRSSIEAKDLLDEDFSIWSLAMGLVQPLFQGGRLRASLSAAEALQRQAAEAYLTAALAAFSEVEAALAAERFLHESLEALAVAADQSLAARDLAERRYRSGLEEYLTVLESQRQATVSQSLLLLARRRQVEARIDLHLALGGDYNQGSASSADAIRESS